VIPQRLLVHPEAMKRNAEMTNGLIVSEAVMMRLTETTGRHHAHHLLYEAAQRAIAERIPFLDAIREHPSLKSHGLPSNFLDEALTIDNYVGESSRLVDKVTAHVRPSSSPKSPQ